METSLMGAWKDTGCILSESKRCRSYDTEEPDDLANPTIILCYYVQRSKTQGKGEAEKAAKSDSIPPIARPPFHTSLTK